jgi:hypothetical protein
MNPPKPRLQPRVAPVPPAYLAAVRALDERRRAAGLSHLALEVRAGIGRGHWAHYLQPDTRAGRLASSKTLARVRAVLGV